GFTSGSLISANGSDLTTTFNNPNTLQAVIPATLLNSPVALQISVRNPTGSVSNGVTFYVLALSPPTMTGISPGFSIRGNSVSVTITGTNLIGASIQVAGDGVSPTVTGGTNTTLQVMVTVDAAAATGRRNVIVTTPVGSTSCDGPASCSFWVTTGG